MDTSKTNVDQKLDIAKALIMTFVAEEYDDGELRPFDYTDLGHIDIAYTTTEDWEYEIQVEISLIDYSINQYVDGELVDSVKYESLDYFIEYELRFLDFCNLIYIENEIMKRFIG